MRMNLNWPAKFWFSSALLETNLNHPSQRWLPALLETNLNSAGKKETNGPHWLFHTLLAYELPPVEDTVDHLPPRVTVLAPSTLSSAELLPEQNESQGQGRVWPPTPPELELAATQCARSESSLAVPRCASSSLCLWPSRLCSRRSPHRTCARPTPRIR
eukprot:COSAG06_NODE_664_length_13285_cov_14.962853_17_plen_159_part_00